ncbi:METTL5 family protein [Halocatena pleomorpha]|uniref:Methyltransferase domain-containing protein n=1 Tax=Halocatena pleomorpha TaxID=1785090 RepID=A0A3P3R458_9EURY|nr:METTL5 family protein [Halocatena pleomorpha]RRJ28266.1 methyltransferase domain-containing protein [Halocatena pleomorpha]
MRRGALERALSVVADFTEPSVQLEQYPTPADIAAHLIHLAGVQGDLDRTIVDLGTGTGMLALGAALCGAPRVIGIDRDRCALTRARENTRRVTPSTHPEWVCADATTLPLTVEHATVVMNPPFGAQRGNEHADRAFLETTADIAAVSYSLHNAGSRSFVEAFADDHGGTVTHAFAVDLELPRQFDFHTDQRRTIDAEAYRVEW